MSVPDEGPDETADAAKLLVSLSSSRTPAKGLKSRGGKKVRYVTPDEELSTAALKRRDRGQNIKLRNKLAWFAIIAVSLQLILANAIFGWYVIVNGAKDLPSEVMIAWLSATVVQVIGIVLIIARNLFPSREKALTRQDLESLMKALRP